MVATILTMFGSAKMFLEQMREKAKRSREIAKLKAKEAEFNQAANAAMGDYSITGNPADLLRYDLNIEARNDARAEYNKVLNEGIVNPS